MSSQHNDHTKCYYLNEKKSSFDGFLGYFVKTILPLLLAVIPLCTWQISTTFDLQKKLEILEVKQAQMNDIKEDLKDLKVKIEEIRIRLGGMK